MNDVENLEEARMLTVEVLLGQKRAYARVAADIRKHVEQLQTRLRVSAATSAGVEEWVSQMERKLGLGAPSLKLSSAIVTLRQHVLSTIGQTAWLNLLEKEHGYLIALMRIEYESRKVEFTRN